MKIKQFVLIVGTSNIVFICKYALTICIEMHYIQCDNVAIHFNIEIFTYN